MNLGKLELNGFLSLRNFEMDFSSLGNVMFIGDNGSGKSSVPDGINWIKFGRTTRSKYHGNKVISNVPDKMSSAYGYLELYDDKDKIEIIREVGKVNQLKLFINEELMEYRLPTLIQKAIEKVLGYDMRTYNNIANFSQNDIGKFISGDSTERIQTISQMFNLMVFDKGKDYCSKRIERFKGDISSIEGSIRVYKESTEGVDAEKLKQNQRKLKKKIGILKKHQLKITEKISNVQSKKIIQDEIDKLEKDIISSKRERDEEIERMSAEYDEVKKNIKRYKGEIKEIDSLKEKVKGYDFLVSEIKNLRVKLKGVDEKISAAKSRRSVYINKLDKYINSIKRGGRYRCLSCGSVIGEKKFNETVGKIKKQIKIVGEKITEHTENRKEIQELIDLAEDSKRDADSIITKIKVLENTKKHIKNYKVQMKNISEKMEEEKRVSSQKISSIKEQIKEKEKELKRYGGIEGDLDELNGRYDSIDGDIKRISEKEGVVGYRIKKYYESKRNLDKYEDELNQLEDEHSKLLFWRDSFPDVKLYMIQDIIPFIEDEANKYLDELLNGKRISLVADSVRKKSKLDIIIEDYEYGIKRIFEGYSGGQGRKMALAMFMALNKMASLRSGKKINFMILDEKFSNIDSKSRHMAIEMMKNEYSDRKLIAIDHDHSLASEFDNVIEFNLVNGITQTKVVR
jgi:DNA repair exonuclease SbcCD ATPase subunit